METIAIIGVIVSIIGGWSFAGYLIFTHLGERQILKYLSYVCYQMILKGQDMLWDDMELLYATETKKITGYSGILTPPEGHELATLINRLCQEHPPKNVNWDLVKHNLARSLPQGWPVALGQNYMSNFGALMMLMGMIGILFRDQAVKGNPTTITIVSSIMVGIPALIYLLIAIMQFRMFLPFWRATRSAKKAAFK